MQFAAVMQCCRNVLKAMLLGALVTWAAAAPIIWILRDGLGPDMVESELPMSALKFAVGWGAPAMVLIPLLIGLWLIDRPRAVRQS